MILHEFAVEPEALSDWQIFKYVMEKFSFSQGRVISRFPKKWEKQVYEILKPKLKDIHIANLEILLSKYKNDRLVNSHRSFHGDASWGDKAIREHINKRFFKIIASSPYEHTDVVSIDEIQEEHFNVTREEKIEKTTNNFVDYTELLLAHSKEILFIDPNFNPNQLKWWKPLSGILYRLKGHQLSRIEYHVNYESGASSKGDNLSQYCQEGRKYIPQGVTIVFIRWSDKYTHNKFHARYILTDIGGMRSEYGFDEGKSGEQTDLSMLDTKMLDLTWKMFQKATPAYQYIDEIKVIGEAQILKER